MARGETKTKGTENAPPKTWLDIVDVYGRIAHSPKGISHFNLAYDLGLSPQQVEDDLFPVLTYLTKEKKIRLSRRGELEATDPPSRLMVAKVVHTEGRRSVILEPVSWDSRVLPRPRLSFISKSRNEYPASVGDTFLVRIKRRHTHKPEREQDGRKTRKVEYECTAWQKLAAGQAATITGIFSKNTGNRGPSIVTDGPTLREIFPLGSKPKDLLLKDGDRVIAAIDEGSSQHRPKARILSLIWEEGQKAEKLSTRIFVNAGIPLLHPLAADRSAKERAAAPIRFEGRIDLRSIEFLTIDGRDAHDHDDAVHAAPDKSPDNKGGFVVTVAIADGLHHVPVGSKVDRFARHQLASVYGYDRVAHKLPPIISEDAGSLVSNRKRYAIVGQFRINSDGETIARNFMRAVIKPRHMLTYEKVDAALEGDKPYPQHVEMLISNLRAAYEALLIRHERAGDIDFLDSKVIPLFTEGGAVKGFVTERDSCARDIIKKLMVLHKAEFGNELMENGMPFIGRINKPPEPKKNEKARTQLEALGIECPDHDEWQPWEIREMISQAGDDVLMQSNVQNILLPMLSRGEYAFEGSGHFALAIEGPYAPSTSPLREYASIVNQRSMGRLKGWYDGPLIENESDEELARLAEAMNDVEIQYKSIQTRTLQSYAVSYLRRFKGQPVDARICLTSGRYGIKVMIGDCPVPFDLPMEAMPPGNYIRSTDKLSLYNERLQKTFRLGDTITVIIDEAEPLEGKEGILKFHVEDPSSTPKYKSHPMPSALPHRNGIKLTHHDVIARIIRGSTKSGLELEITRAEGTKLKGKIISWPLSAMPKGSYKMHDKGNVLFRYPSDKGGKGEFYIPGSEILLNVSLDRQGNIHDIKPRKERTLTPRKDWKSVSIDQLREAIGLPPEPTAEKAFEEDHPEPGGSA